MSFVTSLNHGYSHQKKKYLLNTVAVPLIGKEMKSIVLSVMKC